MVLGIAVVLLSQSCGSGGNKKKVVDVPETAGEGGQAGSPVTSAGGQLGEGGVPTAAGAGGAAGGANAAGASGAASECPVGFGECDGDLSEACEQDLSELDHCGACDVACSNAHGAITCEALACKVGTCLDGYGDCNGDPNDGCETALIENDEHCGACGRDCTSVGATCTVDSCGDIKMQQNIFLGTGNGAFNDRAFAFSSEIGIANLTRTNGKVQLFPLDGSPGKVIWDLAGGESSNETLVIHGQEVIWAQRGTPNVIRKKLATDASNALPTDIFYPEDLPVYLREQGNYFYWISGDYGEPAYVYRRLRDAAVSDPGTRIVDVPQGSASSLSGFAVTTDAIYWVTSDDANAGTTDNDIRTTPLTGGVPVSVPKVAGATDAVIKDFGNFTLSPSLTAVGDTLYFARTIGDTVLNGVYRFKKGDLAPTKLAEAENVTTFAVGEDWIYYGLLAQQGVWRAPIGGGQGVKVGQSYQTTIVGVHDKFAYVAFVNQPSYFYKIFQ